MRPNKLYYAGFILVLIGIITAIYCLMSDSRFFAITTQVSSTLGILTMILGLIGKSND